MKLSTFKPETRQISKLSVSLLEMLTALSTALDLIDPELRDHHQRVAYLAVVLANFKTTA